MKTGKETEVSTHVARGGQGASAEMVYVVSDVIPLNTSP